MNIRNLVTILDEAFDLVEQHNDGQLLEWNLANQNSEWKFETCGKNQN